MKLLMTITSEANTHHIFFLVQKIVLINFFMLKISLAVGAMNVPANSLDFACFISNITKSKLTGVFLENVLEDEYAGETFALAENELSDNQLRELTDQHINFFKSACERRGINSKVYRNRGLPANELIEESGFADLLIIQPDLSFRQKFDGSPSGFVKKKFIAGQMPGNCCPGKF